MAPKLRIIFVLLSLCMASVAGAQAVFPGATTINPNNSFYRIFDAANYGAKCDGNIRSPDTDTSGWQAAINAAVAAGGGKITGPAGVCTLSTDLLTGNGSHLDIDFSGVHWKPVTGGSWLGTINQHIVFVHPTSAVSDIHIHGGFFDYPNPSLGGCQAINLNAGTASISDVTVDHIVDNYCGDFLAVMGANNVKAHHNTVYHITDSCFDNFAGAKNLTITDNYCTVAGNGSIGIEFTNEYADHTAAITTGIIETGNTIVLEGTAEQGINVDLFPTCVSALTAWITIADNHVFMASGKSGWGILVRFCSNVTDVHDNTIVADNTDEQTPAIQVRTPGTNAKVHDNLVWNWNNQNGTLAGRGLFGNDTVGGTIENNECYSCTAAAGLQGGLIGITDATTKITGNDTGTGNPIYKFGFTTIGQLTLAPGTSLSQATWGSNGLGLIAATSTMNDTTTGSGGVTTEAAYAFGVTTFTNTQGTANVLTNAANVYFPAPICGTGWSSCTHLYAGLFGGRLGAFLGADITGSSINLGDSSHATVVNAGTLTFNDTTINGSSVSGTGSLALTTSPVFVTPNLGTPSAVVLTNGTSLPVAALVGNLPSANNTAVYPHGITILCSSGATVQSGSVTTEVNLAVCTVPANYMVANAALRITTTWSNTNTAVAKTATIRYATTAGTPGSAWSTGTAIASQAMTISTAGSQGQTTIRENNGSNAQTTFNQFFTPFTAGGALTATTVTTTNASYINIDCIDASSNGSTEQCGISGYTVELLTP